jgi:S-DNA-T family DNA segregation ATPase FtsK/SpoIIIE
VPRLPVLSQHQFDQIGLGLIALGVLLALPLYFAQSDGVVVRTVVDGLAYTIGSVRHIAPVALVLIGVLFIARPMLPSVKPLRSGGLLLFAAALLMLAAGTFGLGASGSHNTFWQPELVRDRGGYIGEAEYVVARSIAGHLGAHIIGVFLALGGLLLLTGATIAGVLRATGRSVADSTRVIRTAAPARETAAPKQRKKPVVVPEPEANDVVVHATHLEASRSVPDIAADDEEMLDPVIEAEPVPLPELDAEPDEEPAEPVQMDLPHLVEGESGEQVQYVLPDAVSLTKSTGEDLKTDTGASDRIGSQLVEALNHFKIDAKVIGTVCGPHITRYELRLAPGVKMSKVSQLKDDLAYALAATEIRILAPIPGKTAVGIEVPNQIRQTVHLGDVFRRRRGDDSSPLTVWLGKDVSGKAIGADLAKMPHILVAGTTGAGKSGCINAMLSSILLNATPDEARLVLVDPKQVELNHYEDVPHLLTPVITSPRQAANALQNLVREMEWRYGIMAMKRTRSLKELNRVREDEGETKLPYILCVIDELADLMMVAPGDVEDSIIRIAQKARAVGIHLVLATQSPRVDVITGMIKANVPSRIAFAVSSQTDSRVILDQNGAESLLGMGDMLFAPVGSSKLQRIQGAYIDEAQIAEITGFWAKQGQPDLREDLLEQVEPEVTAGSEEGAGMDPDEDPLLEDAIRLVVEMGTASTSMLQRRMRLGYTRAGRMMDMLERRGVISGYEGSKPRQVLVTESDLPRILAALAERGDIASAPVPEPVGAALFGDDAAESDAEDPDTVVTPRES